MTDPPRLAKSVARPATEAGTNAFVVTPFARLARAHVAGTIADAMVAAAFAGSLFFGLPEGEARTPVLRYLLITMLPFSVLSPAVGPLMDRIRGGHRFVVIGSGILRALLCYLLIGQIKGAGTGFFLLALCLLVCQKAYQVARSALVPSVVRSDRELVEANSKLSLLSGLSSFAGVVPAAALMKLFGPEWAIGLAMVTYVVAAGLATQIPGSRVASAPADAAERHELRGAGIVMAGTAMGVLRACVGFLTMLIAFDFRGGDRATWEFAVVGGASVVSQLFGAGAAPRIRDHASEENLLTASLGIVAVGGVLSLLLGDVLGAAVLGSSVGFSAATGKLAFDSILQRDAPDANRGRAFAKFETRFQVMWVLGALLPVGLAINARPGFAVVLAAALIGLGLYAVGRLAYSHRMGTRQTAASAAAVGIEERFAEVSGEFKGRITQAPRAVIR
ncbi:MAG: MFS transporter, partial [Aquihabitans sp.]